MIFSALDLPTTRKICPAYRGSSNKWMPLPPSPAHSPQTLLASALLCIIDEDPRPRKGHVQLRIPQEGLRKDSDLCPEPADFHVVKTTGKTLPSPVTGQGLRCGVSRGQESSPTLCPITTDSAA